MRSERAGQWPCRNNAIIAISTCFHKSHGRRISRNNARSCNCNSDSGRGFSSQGVPKAGLQSPYRHCNHGVRPVFRAPDAMHLILPHPDASQHSTTNSAVGIRHRPLYLGNGQQGRRRVFLQEKRRHVHAIDAAWHRPDDPEGRTVARHRIYRENHPSLFSSRIAARRRTPGRNKQRGSTAVRVRNFRRCNPNPIPYLSLNAARHRPSRVPGRFFISIGNPAAHGLLIFNTGWIKIPTLNLLLKKSKR